MTLSRLSVTGFTCLLPAPASPHPVVNSNPLITNTAAVSHQCRDPISSTMSSPAADTNNKTKRLAILPPNLRNALSLPPRWLAMYDDFVIKNASQVAQMESALRSLTYIIPGTYPPIAIPSIISNLI